VLLSTCINLFDVGYSYYEHKWPSSSCHLLIELGTNRSIIFLHDLL
jgi:hypothetical protein